MTKYNEYKNKSYSLRISDEKKRKIKTIAKKEGYISAAKLYDEIITNYINKYESKHGEITGYKEK